MRQAFKDTLVSHSTLYAQISMDKPFQGIVGKQLKGIKTALASNISSYLAHKQFCKNVSNWCRIYSKLLLVFANPFKSSLGPYGT